MRGALIQARKDLLNLFFKILENLIKHFSASALLATNCLPSANLIHRSHD